MSISEIKLLLSSRQHEDELAQIMSLNWLIDTALIRQIRYTGLTVTLWTDQVTGQARVFVDSEIGEQDGKLALIGGSEIAPAEWN